MRNYCRIIFLIVSLLILMPLNLYGQGYGEDPNSIDFGFDSGNSFSYKPSFCQRLSGVKNIVLLEPTQKSQWDNYIYGNYANYFRSLGVNVRVIPSSDYKKTSSNAYGAPIVWCNFYGSASDYCESANSLIVGLSYGTSPGADDHLVLWACDVPNNFNWETRISGVPNKGVKLVEKFKKSLCSSYYYNKAWEYRPKCIESTLTEQKFKQEFSAGKDVAIYQGDNYRLGLYQTDQNDIFLVYLGGREKNVDWKIGDIKASLEKTSTPGVYLAKWWGKWKQLMFFTVIISDGLLKTYDEDKDEDIYIQSFPTVSDKNNSRVSKPDDNWTGTGFALKNGYIVTNYHVIEGAKSITIQGIKGNFNTSYNAVVVGSDKNNDLALLKISDSSFTGFGAIPYSVSSNTSEVGEEIFVLGYPLTSTMGDEIKLTTGIISSKTGFQGDVALYQISAPIQPGNSGGPLFDKKGNVIGIVSAKHAGAENVGYAIKTLYLCNLVESCANVSIIPTANRVSTLPLTGKVKSEKNFVFFIKCNANISSSEVSHRESNVKEGSRVIQSPSFKSKEDGNLIINTITITPSETILECSSTNPLQAGWMNISKDAYIQVDGIKYRLAKAEGIAYAPKYTYFDYPNQTRVFKLFFPNIPFKATAMDFIESPTSEWKILGINLK